MQAKIFHKPLFWVIATAVAAGFGYSAFRLFPIAFPLVSVDISMDRSLALERAASLAKEQLIGPNEYRTAVAFASDNKAKIFIQLDGGGVQKFQEVIEEKYFAPYYWQVRHFNTQEKHEATFYFMPDGRPYGFKEKIAETVELANLTKPQAQELAQHNAATLWGINFNDHVLVEHSTDEKPNGRIDHTLVYERTQEKIADAPFHVTIKVTGNKVSKVAVSLKVPEAFERRYANMRSANNLIASWASTALFLLYILLGCILGLFLLIRSDKHWLIWRAPFICAGFISLGMLLDSLNSYSQWWFAYQTTDTAFNFIARQLQSTFIGTSTNFVILLISFVAAESLTRKAFPSQIQLWPSARTDVASSWQLLGRTYGGYLMSSLSFLFVTVFYLFSIKYLGWWSPSDTLVDPNVLATYAPWFSPFINALRAGFWEECLFRAVPLASAMLLAKRYGKKYWWMTSAMIIQALIFAGAHANYPAQPSYARLIELILPSFVFGGLYLAFGLIPAIVSHVTYDIILMALPILISDAPGSFVNKIMVTLCTLLPILVVFYARYKKGRFHTLAERWYNYNWQSPHTTTEQLSEPVHTEPEQPSWYKIVVLVAGLVACVAWGYLRPTEQDIQPLSITRDQALEQAKLASSHFNMTIPEHMTTLPSTRPAQDKLGTFVWRVGGKEMYKQFSGTFVNPALWKVRSAEFDGDITQSAEEYSIYLGPDGTPFEFNHILPKEQQGASLSEEQARALTIALLQSYYKLNPEEVVEISAQETKQPNRRDWEFIYKLKNAPDLQGGQLRIRVKIGGDQIISHDRLVYAPEEWERGYAAESSFKSFIQLSSLLLFLTLMAILGMGIIRRRQLHPFNISYAVLVFTVLALKSGIQTVNLWPIMIAQFKTSVPYSRQVIMLLIHLILQTVMISLFFGWLSGYVVGLLKGRCTKRRIETLGQGIAIGLCIAALSALADWLIPATKPLILDTSNADTYLPLLSMALKVVMPVIAYTAIGLFAVHGLNMISDYGQKKHALIITTLVVFGFALSGFEPSISLTTLIASGLLTGILLSAVYYVALRYNYCLVPVIVATHLSINALQEGLLKAFPGALLGALFTIAACWLIAFGALSALSRNNEK